MIRGSSTVVWSDVVQQLCDQMYTAQQKFPNSSFKDPTLNMHIFQGEIKVVKDEQFISAHFDTSFI